MADPGSDNGVDALRLSDVEAALARIPSVTAARVVAGDGGRISEVHLLARRDRAPKQLVRDVQSVALARFGIDVDYRTISVVQLDEPLVEAADPQPRHPRPALTKVSADVSGHACEIRVHVDVEGREQVGVARGPAATWVRLVARAVVDAVVPLLESPVVEAEFAEVVEAANYKVALVVLRMITPRGDQLVSGSAVVHRDLHDAVARATLAAMNRLLGGM